MKLSPWRLPLVLGAFLVVAGCAQPAEKPAEVAALPTTSTASAGTGTGTAAAPPTTAGGAGGAAQERPRRRMDMSADEEVGLWNVYYTCLGKNGAKIERNPVMMPGAGKENPTVVPLTEIGSNPAAHKACESKMPLPPWEMDDNNPTYKDNFHKWVVCMNNRGLKIQELPDGWTYGEGNTKTPQESGKIENDCKKEAFVGGAK